MGYLRMTRLEFASVPPSLNRVGARSDWRTFRRHKKAWERDVWLLLRADRGLKPMVPPVFVQAWLRFPKMRKRDEGNYRSILEKAVGDALQLGGYIPDDDPENYRFIAVTFEPRPGTHRTILEFTEGADLARLFK